jgi:hypothetical protein
MKLTQYSHAAGCGCKMAPSELEKLLGERQPSAFKNLLVGNQSNDDAAVWDLGNGEALVSTVDFFMPIVDGAWDFGRIAAANAISDVYAMGAKPIFDAELRDGFEKAGFTIRYEQTIGTVESSWKRLMELKHPPATLEHLGLKIMPITLESEIPQILDLYRKVGQSSGFHTYFSHQKANLLAEQQVLKEMINLGKGCLLGVYKEKTLLGAMYCHIGQAIGLAETEGGMSFMLDPSIQNLGIVKTGYRLLLEFLREKKIPNFVGTTSQPAIKRISDYLDRRPQMMIYIKSTTLSRA